MAVIGSVAAGLIAALTAMQINRFLLNPAPVERVYLLGPAVEETLKTGLAFLAGGSFFIVHSAFGFTEGAWEYLKKNGSLKPALAAWATHSFLGLLVLITYNNTGNIIFAWLSGYLIHTLWNRTVLSLHK